MAMLFKGIPQLNRSSRVYGVLVLICSGLAAIIFIYIHYSEHGEFPSPKQKFEELGWAILITNLAGFFVYQVDRLLDRFLNWRNHFLLRFVSGLLANSIVAGTVMISSSVYLIRHNENEIAKLSVLLLISLFIYEIFYGWFFSYRYYAHTQVEQLRSERWQMELQFESLKNQISPHYLFNCLNTVSSLLFKDSHMAEEFIRRMADSFRYVLNNQKNKLVTLREEIEFVKSYYYLLQVRYEHHLKLEINLPKNILDSPIPPLTLQMLVENAVKHNQISKEYPLLIYFTAQDNTHLQVISTKTIAQKNVSSFKVGLDNIRTATSFIRLKKYWCAMKTSSLFSCRS
jgi:Putative regulator of cell autolysis